MNPSAEIVDLAKQFHEAGGCKGRKAFKCDLLITPTGGTTCIHWDGEMPEDYIPILTESELRKWLSDRGYYVMLDGSYGWVDFSYIDIMLSMAETHLTTMWGKHEKHSLHAELYTAAVWVAERGNDFLQSEMNGWRRIWTCR